jgi:glycosyltransferase involved in cell wall biosynthesis
VNRPVRVLLIGRRFWPHGGFDSAGYLTDLACGLNRRGVHVEICTPRYAASWPDRFWFREIPVHRPAAAPRSDWSISRYTRHMTHWLRHHAASFDAILVDSLREESVAAVEACRGTACACIVRYAGYGIHSDAAFWNTSRAARRCAAIAKMADAVIAKSAICNRALIADRFSPDRVHRIGTGFAAGPIRSADQRATARAVLGAVNSDLRTDDDTPIAICNSPMSRGSGACDLVSAARHLIAKHPALRIWFLGDGPYRDWIYEQLRSEGVRASIAMPGSFSHVDDLYAAADVYLQTDDSGLDHFLPAAVSAELPVVAIHTDATRAVLTGASGRLPTPAGLAGENEPGGWVRWVEEPTYRHFVAAVTSVLDNAAAARSDAANLRRYWLRHQPMTATIDRYVDLIEQVVARKQDHRPGRSAEVIS